MNTVGKPGKLGEHIRCVVSVVDADRGLGRQHGHPHPRHPGLRDAAPVRAGGWPGPAPSHATTRTRRACSSPVRRGVRRSVQLPVGGGQGQGQGCQAGADRPRAAGAAEPADRVPARRRLPLRDAGRTTSTPASTTRRSWSSRPRRSPCTPRWTRSSARWRSTPRRPARAADADRRVHDGQAHAGQPLPRRGWRRAAVALPATRPR